MNPKTNMRCKTLTLLSLAAAALVFTGCDGGKAQMTTGETNVLGLYKNVQESYCANSSEFVHNQFRRTLHS